MRQPFCFNLLISSPTDVLEERNLVEQLCTEWNSSYGQVKNVLFETKRWEKNLNVDSRKKPQILVEEQFILNCDILFAIFGKGIGTRTETYASATIEEIEKIINLNKPFFIYFMEYAYPLKDLTGSQISKLKRLQKKLKKTGSYKEIADQDNLRKHFLSDLTYHSDGLLRSTQHDNKNNSRSKNNLTNDVSLLKIDLNKIEDYTSSKENWFELSINDLINKYLEENNQQFAIYKRGITYMENCSLWKSLSDINYKALLTNAKAAREFAFNIKYGNFDYEKDLRSKYKDWYREIVKIISDYNLTKNTAVIGVGSNYGQELGEIFNNEIFENNRLSVLDLSNDAINKGKKHFPDIIFSKGDMEESPLKNAEYDIYLNLRSIHSSGVDFKLALADCQRILKPGGLAIISVSNGYLIPNKPGSDQYFEMLGLFDNRTLSFTKHRSLELARKISSKMIDYGFKNPSITTGPSEIFIYAQK